MQYDIQVKSSSSQVFYFCVYQYTLFRYMVYQIYNCTELSITANVFFLPKSSATQGQAH